MWFFFVYALLFPLEGRAGPSSLEEHKNFLEYKENKKHFEQRRKAYLQERLREREFSRKAPSSDNRLKEHKKKQQQIERKRKIAFSSYKKQHSNYRQKQKQILKKRLKEIKKIRSRKPLVEFEEPLF